MLNKNNNNKSNKSNRQHSTPNNWDLVIGRKKEYFNRELVKIPYIG